MSAEDDAYAVLGLDSGADADAVERAYRTLIKRFHPDRIGGDIAKATTINRSYQLLRESFARRHVAMRPPLPIRVPPGPRGVLVALAVLFAVAGLAYGLIGRGPTPVASNLAAAAGAERAPPPAQAMTEALDQAGIEAAVAEARGIVRDHDEMTLSRWSQRCFGDLRGDPHIAHFDRCAAFDDAAVRLLDRDPLRDKGAFSQIAVTGRQWSAAAALSDNNFAIDARLKAIQARVASVLAERPPPGNRR